MCYRRSLAAIVALIGVSQFTPCLGGTLPELSCGVGFVAPLGNFERYVDAGPTLGGRYSHPLGVVPGLSLSGSITWCGFRRDEHQVAYNEVGYYSSATFVSKDQSYDVMVGLRLTSPSDRAFFRPVIAGGMGLFAFVSNESLAATAYDGEETEVWSQVNDFRIRPGARLDIGADFFFRTHWGIGMTMTWENIWNLRRPNPSVRGSSTVQFSGITISLVIPITSSASERN